MLNSEKVLAKVGALDCTVHKRTCNKFDIQGYPTLKFFENGIFKKDFDGQRTENEIFKFMKSYLSPVKDEF